MGTDGVNVSRSKTNCVFSFHLRCNLMDVIFIFILIKMIYERHREAKQR